MVGSLTTNTYNGRVLWPAPPTATIHKDASSTGWGATWDEVVPARGFHEAGRKDPHINLLELGAVRLGLLSFLNFLKQPKTIVRLVTDPALSCTWSTTVAPGGQQSCGS